MEPVLGGLRSFVEMREVLDLSQTLPVMHTTRRIEEELLLLLLQLLLSSLHFQYPALCVLVQTLPSLLFPFLSGRQRGYLDLPHDLCQCLFPSILLNLVQQQPALMLQFLILMLQIVIFLLQLVMLSFPLFGFFLPITFNHNKLLFDFRLLLRLLLGHRLFFLLFLSQERFEALDLRVFFVQLFLVLLGDFRDGLLNLFIDVHWITLWSSILGLLF
mmetsp:Transcript_74589/g.187814  ORF Transcript_74589/g.187814 Transcript_74589/m.187814 type:complete len:216 (+) Transcript_74589:1491-2138(+)